MSVSVQSSNSSRFVDHSLNISSLALLLMMIAGIGSLFFPQQVTNQMVKVLPEETTQLSPITIERRLVGALRIDVKAIIPTNHWVVYEIRLYDDQNELLASAIKEAWKESGVWREDGETGTWSESDLLGGLDVRLAEKKREDITIAVAVLEYGETRGQVITDQPVSFRVDVDNGVIDGRYLWVGFFGVLFMVILNRLSVTTTGKVRIRKTIKDSDVGERAIVGGENSLIRVTVNVKSDETSPQSLAVNLWLKDGTGEQIYSEQTRIKLNFRRDDGEIEDATGKLEQYFVFTRRGSYGFYVEVTPDQPVDETTLIVTENAKTQSGNKPVKIITVDAD
ncbi:hypothetical protein PCC7418_2911 [Halothece sp. PCC 7418]|uniref:hypothetical protein n=1 Tax=Halothece sp. (strain PCC 7418) TaxID=65093 RepID=UPI0002A06F80|nr:hypothetical protein [Halothece sp. PCC 7418]AFZ45041.1 hypothetical protein PCC7418_2911 [Halothece sp. PCC 7418]